MTIAETDPILGIRKKEWVMRTGKTVKRQGFFLD